MRVAEPVTTFFRQICYTVDTNLQCHTQTIGGLCRGVQCLIVRRSNAIHAISDTASNLSLPSAAACFRNRADKHMHALYTVHRSAERYGCDASEACVGYAQAVGGSMANCKPTNRKTSQRNALIFVLEHQGRTKHDAWSKVR
jgi:hypothetical protein